jgi:hypothetical protein
MDEAPSPEALLDAARRHFPDCRLVGRPLRLWRQRPSAEQEGLLDLVHPAAGWVAVAWDGHAEPLGLLEIHADGTEVAHRTAEKPWLPHALHLALAQLHLPELHAAYAVAVDAPGTGLERAVVADLLHCELVVPLQDGAQVLDGMDFASLVWRHARRG